MIKLERILCPLDLSPESGDPLRYAIALANSYEATLCLCHCVERPAHPGDSCREELCKELENLMCGHCGLINPETIRRQTLIVEGKPDGAIARVAAEKQVDLIVMSSRRRPMAAA